MAALLANQGNVAYAASKAALLAHVRGLAIETARRGVTVNYIAPGFIDTAMLAKFSDHRDPHGRADPCGTLCPAGRRGAGGSVSLLARSGLYHGRRDPG